MALNIKDPETEQLATEVAALTGESKTRAVRIALQERKDRLRLRGITHEDRATRLRHFLENEVWPHIPTEELDKPPLTKAQREEILGIGPDGV